MASDRLRILHVTRDFPPQSNGGLSSAVDGLVRALAGARTSCMVVSFDDYRPTKASGGELEPIGERRADGVEILRIKGAQALPRATELAAAFAAQVVHVHHEMLWDFASEVALAHQSARVISVHTLQSEQNRLRSVESTMSSESQRRALAESSAVHAPSQTVASLLGESGLRLGGPVHVIRLGLGKWPEAERAFHRDRFAGPPLLLYVGRFADINGFAELLEALPAIFAEHDDLRALIAGGVPSSPRAERRWKERWHDLAGEYAERVDFAGWLAAKELSELYARATLLVVPSWFETFGQVLLEGMLHGTPIVTTGAGALGELVDADSALLIAAQSADAIAEGVGRLLADPPGANRRREQAFLRAQRDSPWEDRVSEMLALYASLA